MAAIQTGVLTNRPDRPAAGLRASLGDGLRTCAQTVSSRSITSVSASPALVHS